MAEYDKNNRGTLSRNDRKDSERHPDVRGQCVVNNEEYWLAGWRKTGPDGNTFYSLSFTPKEPRAERSTPDRPLREEIDDDLPF